jgi:hypothetical protein
MRLLPERVVDTLNASAPPRESMKTSLPLALFALLASNTAFAAAPASAVSSYLLRPPATTCSSGFATQVVSTLSISGNGDITFGYAGMSAIGPIPHQYAPDYLQQMRKGDTVCVPTQPQMSGAPTDDSPVAPVAAVPGAGGVAVGTAFILRRPARSCPAGYAMQTVTRQFFADRSGTVSGLDAGNLFISIPKTIAGDGELRMSVGDSVCIQATK